MPRRKYFRTRLRSNYIGPLSGLNAWWTAQEMVTTQVGFVAHAAPHKCKPREPIAVIIHPVART